METQNC